MEFFDAVNGRRSIRAFTSKPVEEDKIRRVLEAANAAPSAGNLQSYEIFLIKDEEKKKEMAGAVATAYSGNNFIANAPVVLVFCANRERAGKYGERGRSLYAVQDATISAAYCQLAATALGLSSVWVGSFDEAKTLKVLKDPKGLTPVAVIPLGYPAEDPKPRPRRKLEEIVHEVQS
jgi:nitroreductase